MRQYSVDYRGIRVGVFVQRAPAIQSGKSPRRKRFSSSPSLAALATSLRAVGFDAGASDSDSDDTRGNSSKSVKKEAAEISQECRAGIPVKKGFARKESNFVTLFFTTVICARFKNKPRRFRRKEFGEAGVWVLLGDSGENQGFRCQSTGEEGVHRRNSDACSIGS
ncbi:hypothetical protein U1Q18_035286 [Sarracenia purpurea var. burkii]